MSDINISILGNHERGMPYDIKKTEDKILITPKKFSYLDIVFSMVFFVGLGSGAAWYIYNRNHNILASFILFILSVIISIAFIIISIKIYNKEIGNVPYFIYRFNDDVIELPRYKIKDKRKNIKLDIVEGFWGEITQTKAIEFQAELKGKRYLILRFPSALMLSTKKVWRLLEENNIEINHNKVG